MTFLLVGRTAAVIRDGVFRIEPDGLSTVGENAIAVAERDWAQANAPACRPGTRLARHLVRAWLGRIWSGVEKETA